MQAEGALPRIGAFTAACVLISNAVGSGIFTTTGFLARDLGDPFWILGLWAVGGAWAMNENFNLFGEYSQPDMESDVYIMTFGASYNF